MQIRLGNKFKYGFWFLTFYKCSLQQLILTIQFWLIDFFLNTKKTVTWRAKNWIYFWGNYAQVWAKSNRVQRYLILFSCCKQHKTCLHSKFWWRLYPIAYLTSSKRAFWTHMTKIKTANCRFRSWPKYYQPRRVFCFCFEWKIISTLAATSWK